MDYAHTSTASPRPTTPIVVAQSIANKVLENGDVHDLSSVLWLLELEDQFWALLYQIRQRYRDNQPALLRDLWSFPSTCWHLVAQLRRDERFQVNKHGILSELNAILSRSTVGIMDQPISYSPVGPEAAARDGPKTAPKGFMFHCPSLNCRRRYTKVGHYYNHLREKHYEILHNNPNHQASTYLRPAQDHEDDEDDSTSPQPSSPPDHPPMLTDHLPQGPVPPGASVGTRASVSTPYSHNIWNSGVGSDPSGVPPHYYGQVPGIPPGFSGSMVTNPLQAAWPPTTTSPDEPMHHSAYHLDEPRY